MFEELARIEDQKFIDQVNSVIEWHNLLNEPHCWRDGKGVMHALGPVVGISLDTGKQDVIGRKPKCGYPYKSTVEHDPESTITCFACLVHVGEY